MERTGHFLYFQQAFVDLMVMAPGWPHWSQLGWKPPSSGRNLLSLLPPPWALHRAGRLCLRLGGAWSSDEWAGASLWASRKLGHAGLECRASPVATAGHGSSQPRALLVSNGTGIWVSHLALYSQ